MSKMIDLTALTQYDKLVKGSLGKLAGTYATLAALQTAYPSGTTGNFLVEANGHWYYWDGAWTDGGVYSGMKIDSSLNVNSDNAISNKAVTSEFKKLTNKFIMTAIASHPLWINVPLKSGVQYRIYNLTSSAVDLASYNEAKTTQIQSFPTMSGKSYKTITPSNDAFYLLLYPSGSGTIIVEDLSTELYPLESETLLKIGAGTDYPTIKEGFEVARILGKGVIITAGTYDLVSEGISGSGYILPKKVYGYGVTLVCNLQNEDWSLSPLNCSYSDPMDVEVYGLTVICSNCRYNIHDDMGAMSRGKFYRHVFKDLTLIHNSPSSSVLIRPNNIGGGFGDSGEVYVENCIMESQSNTNSDYHSSFAEVQTAGCKAFFKDCVLNKTITVASVGSSSSYINKVYVTNCRCDTVPSDLNYTNISLIAWNNAQG